MQNRLRPSGQGPALAGRAGLQEAGTEDGCGPRWAGRVRLPVDLPEGATTRRPDGGSWSTAVAVTLRAAVGPPCGRATPGRREAARAPAWRSKSGANDLASAVTAKHRAAAYRTPIKSFVDRLTHIRCVTWCINSRGSPKGLTVIVYNLLAGVAVGYPPQLNAPCTVTLIGQSNNVKHFRI